jgi:hypothetical protein
MELSQPIQQCLSAMQRHQEPLQLPKKKMPETSGIFF